jgi:hypothetical protein
VAIIHVPRPKQTSRDPNRKASSLLLTQVEHMHAAEKRLPIRYHTEIYTNAIKTEGEAAEYIASATAAIHKAHDDATKRKVNKVRKEGRLPKIAAVAAEESARSRKSKKTDSTLHKVAGAKSKSTRGASQSGRKK